MHFRKEEIASLARSSDALRRIEDASPISAPWQCRYVPPVLLQRLNLSCDRRLDHLLYYQTLISEEL